jgi:exodeoxyribonuclease VII small subunit
MSDKARDKKKQVSPGENVCFEEALGKLEVIVNDLEGGELSLEEALARVEEGITLSRQCMRKLSQIEARIDLLLTEEQGQLSSRPVSLGGDTEC